MHILGLSGSQRRVSTNRALLAGLSEIVTPPDRMQVFDGIGDLPIFSPDLEASEPTSVIRFFAAIREADVIVISSPEYVRTIPGGLKNAIDWLVSRDEIIHKPLALLHASHRGDDMLSDLRRVLSTVSTRFLDQVFARFELMMQTPEEIRVALADSDQHQRLLDFLGQLRREVEGAAPQ